MADETPVADAEHMPTTLVKARPVGRALLVADTLKVEAEQRALLGKYVSEQMVEGTDYGVIPGTKNRTLLKPGAEKLAAIFKCVPQFRIEQQTEDHATGFFFYRFSCEIVTMEGGAVVAEGVGSCSTFESRYRWRNENRKCPTCGKESIIKGKAEYGGGWLCWKKKDGCGAQFREGDQAIEGQSVGRVENPDLADQANTVLKIAKKRALVDAAIALARCSDIFTQDMEDHGHREEPPRQEPPKAKPVDVDAIRAKWKAMMASDPSLSDFNRFVDDNYIDVPQGMRKALDTAIQAHAEQARWVYVDGRFVPDDSKAANVAPF